MIAPSEILQAQYVLAFPDPILTPTQLRLFGHVQDGANNCG